MLKQAVNYYHELLNNPQFAEASTRALDSALEHGKLIFGGRRLSPYLRPHFVTEPDWEQVKTICETVFKLGGA